MGSENRRGWAVRSSCGAGLLLAISVANVAKAETTLSAGSWGAQTWTAANSPYLVTGSLELESLTVEAGTTVRFASSPDAPQGLAVYVDGPLRIEGTTEAPSLFEPAEEGAYWFGIRATSATVAGAILRFGQAGIATTTTETMVVRSSVFERSLLQPGGPLEVDGSQFVVAAAAILGHEASVVVTNSVFRGAGPNPGGWALDVQGDVSVTNCTFDLLGAAFYYGDNAVVRNSIFSNLRQLVNRGEPDVSSSLLWQVNRELASGWLVEGEGILREDPRYAPGDVLRLQPSSPAVDSGSAENAPDLDLEGHSRPQGAGIDLGAYELVLTSAGAGGQGGDANSGVGDAGADGLQEPIGGSDGSGGTRCEPRAGSPSSTEGGGKGSSEGGTRASAGEGGAPKADDTGCAIRASRSAPWSEGWSAFGLATALLAATRRSRRPSAKR
jgi:hypothetical protein